ncbi:MAG: hypothetical protein PHP64_03415 [Actinomycetota bacterium]|nr:hypothetical protein [Actinomycetota bacterium]
MELMLLLLVVLGAAVLYLPEIIRERVFDSPLESVSDFKRGMMALSTSTHGYKFQSPYEPSPQIGNGPEPYIKRNFTNYEGDDYDEYSDDEIIPYPRNRAKVEMIRKRKRITLLLLALTMGTGILIIIPRFRWAIPIHVAILVILACYILLALSAQDYERYR